VSAVTGRVLVIGAGFLGRAIAGALAASGERVRLADCRPVEPPAGVAWTTLDAAIERNTPDALAAARAFDPDAAVLAFGVGVGSAADVRQTMLANAVYPAEVAAWLATQTGCRTVVQLGSCFEYGGGEALAESEPPRPFNVYGASKVAAALALEAAAAAHGLQVLHLRLFTVFGLGEAEGRLVPSLFRAALEGAPLALSDGRQARDWVYVADVAAFVAAALAARARLAPYEILNVCSGRGVTVRELVAQALERLRARFGVAPAAVTFAGARKWRGEPDAVVGDPARAERLLGWRPAWSLDVAVDAYFDQYRRVSRREVGA